MTNDWSEHEQWLQMKPATPSACAHGVRVCHVTYDKLSICGGVIVANPNLATS